MSTKPLNVWAVVCPGPSIRCYPGADHFHRDDSGRSGGIIAVNRACLQVDADWWAFMDAKSYYETMKDGGPPKLMHWLLPWWMPERLNLWQLPLERQPIIRSFRSTLAQGGFVRQPFTVNNAILAALSWGADLVKCYGIDWSGNKDWDGTSVAGDRTDDRWAREKEIFQRVQRLAESRGKRVERMVL